MIIKARSIAKLSIAISIPLALNPNIFERFFFLNEILSLLGLLVFFRYFNRRSHRDTTFKALKLYFISLAAVYISSAFYQTNIYAYARHSSILYSTFAFFAGVLVIQNASSISSLTKHINRKLLTIALIASAPIQRIFALGIFPILFMRGGRTNDYVWLSISLITVTLAYGGGSSILAAAYLLIIYFSKRAIVYFTIATTTLIAIVTFLATNYAELSAFLFFKVPPHRIGGAIEYIYNTDPNSLTRLALWMYSLKIWLTTPIFGIGFGTEMFNPAKILISFEDDSKNAEIGYFLGAHNSIITLLTRSGLIVTFFFITFKALIMKNFFRYKNSLSPLEVVSTNCFFITFSILFFNVVLESPIYSGFFWFTSGLAYQSIINAKTRHSLLNYPPTQIKGIHVEDNSCA